MSGGGFRRDAMVGVVEAPGRAGEMDQPVDVAEEEAAEEGEEKGVGLV